MGPNENETNDRFWIQMMTHSTNECSPPLAGLTGLPGSFLSPKITYELVPNIKFTTRKLPILREREI